MAAFEEHCKDCERLLGDRCENVNHWLDDCFKKFGPQHRFSRHHWRGVQEAAELFGKDHAGRVLAHRAAAIHILKDCGFVPKARDWEEKKVDSLGILIEGKFNGYWDPWQFDEAAKKLLANMEGCD